MGVYVAKEIVETEEKTSWSHSYKKNVDKCNDCGRKGTVGVIETNSWVSRIFKSQVRKLVLARKTLILKRHQKSFQNSTFIETRLELMKQQKNVLPLKKEKSEETLIC